jgi:O-antigen/teichoic acid export membrane protein
MNGIAMGLRWIGRVNVGEIARASGQLVLVVALVWWLRLGVLGAFLAYCGALLTQAVYLALLSSRFRAAGRSGSRVLAAKLIRAGIGFAAALFVINLNYRADIMLLHRFLASSEVGLYSVAVALAEMVWQVPTILGFVIFAHSATADDAAEFTRRNIKLLRRVMPLMIVVGGLVAAVSPFLVPAFYGSAFRPSVSVVWILLPGIVAAVPARLAHGDLAGRGDPISGLKVFSLSLIINLILNLFLIPRYGIHGAAVATTVSYTLATLLLYPGYLRIGNEPQRRQA